MGKFKNLHDEPLSHAHKNQVMGAVEESLKQNKDQNSQQSLKWIISAAATLILISFLGLQLFNKSRVPNTTQGFVEVEIELLEDSELFNDLEVIENLDVLENWEET